MATAQLLRPGHVIRARSQSWVVHRHVAGEHGSVLEVRGLGTHNRGTRTSFLLPYEPIERLPSSETPRIVGPRTWRAAARSILAAATPSYDALRSPARAAVAVLPFQLEPVLALVRGLAARVLIADEVGLGKTIQAGLIISELLERRPDARVLVVTPAGLRDQWQAELRERFAREPALLDSASIARHAAQWNGNPWSIPGVVLTSLDYVKRPEVMRALEALIWDVIVFDEAHALAGRSDRATAAAILARRARTLVLLTATPHSGDDEAFGRLTSLGDFTRGPFPVKEYHSQPASDRDLPAATTGVPAARTVRGGVGAERPGSTHEGHTTSQFPLLVFRRTRHDVGMSSARHTVSLRVRPTAHELEMHKVLMAYARLVWEQTSAAAPAARLAMTMLTRRACSSAWSLARSVETRLGLLSPGEGPDHLLQMTLPFGDPAADDEAPVGELSSPGLSDHGEERRWLEHLLRLARLAEPAQSKLRALRRLLRRTREPAIVFTEYRDTLHQLAHHLLDFAPVQLHGGMNGVERHDVLRRFANGEARLLLATDAASEGLNLHQRCRLVINLELPWTPVRLEQRIGRVERLGQERHVHAVHLLAANTCEEESVAGLLARMRRVAGVLSGMRAAACEQEIASVAIGLNREGLNRERRPDTTPVALPGIVAGSLRSSATEEAARLEQVRRLYGRTGHDSFEGRPCVTVLRGRGARSVNDWVYRLVFEDSELQPFWATVVGIRDEASLFAPANSAIRKRIEWLTATVEPVLTPVAQRLLSAFLATVGPLRSLAIARERAIADGLRQQRARLAGALLQPGLFDRRAERAAAAQNATLDEALDRCARRLAELDRDNPVSIDRRLAFGVVRR